MLEKYGLLRPLSKKASGSFKRYVSFIGNQLEQTIITLRTDGEHNICLKNLKCHVMNKA